MTELSPPHRLASADDADALTQLINYAGEGMPLYLWSGMANEGQSPWEVGRQRARRQSGGFSWRNSVLREEAGQVVAGLVGYPLADEPEPIDHDEMPPMFVPLQELENLACSTWYVNVLATFPEHRGKGYGSALLAIAEQRAHATDRIGMSLIVNDANAGARKLYERHGYVVQAERAIVKEDWDGPGQNWLLMTRLFAGE